MKQRNVLLLIQPAYPERIQGIARFAKSHGWHLTIVDRLARFPRGWRGDGALVTLRGNEKTNRFVRALVKDGIPVVDLTLNHPEIKLPRVSGDHAAFGRLARQHFESLNFRHFAWFSTGWSHVHELRFSGFSVGDPSRGRQPDAAEGRPQETQDCIDKNGVCPQRWVLKEILSPSKIDNWRLFLKVIGKRIEKSEKPLGILTYDDTDAAKVLSAALEVGLQVPQDVAIMGIGNDRVVCENQAVPLSSVDHDLERNGYEGAALLDKLMSDRRNPQTLKHSNTQTLKHPNTQTPKHSNTQTLLIPPRGIVVRKSTDTLAADDPLLADALREIARRLPTAFGVNEVADALHVSRTQLDKLFAEKFARSIGKEIVRQRIERAKKLLTETDKPMKEIAALCGFCNAGYFTNTFRTATGVTPKAWRQNR